MTIYLLFLVFISGPSALSPGDQIPDDSDIFSSKKECVDRGILLAQVMLIKTRDKYSVKCVKTEYKPPVLP